jgi:hypothetical protein
VSFLLFWAFSFWLPPSAPQPRPDLTPDEVVRIVVAALRNYNSPIPNAGVFTAYRFASPANRAVTGPYGHFLQLVKSADFAPLLSDHPSDLGAIEIKKDHAEQIARVHSDPSHDAVFKFILSRQGEGPYRTCWMVDGVYGMLPGP